MGGSDMGFAGSVLQIGVPGGVELLLILLIVLFLFGASKLPKLARSTGRATNEFKRGREEMREELEAMADDEGDRDAG